MSDEVSFMDLTVNCHFTQNLQQVLKSRYMKMENVKCNKRAYFNTTL